jgi:hypothetical protein
LRREVNAVNVISATSAWLIQRCSASSQTAFGYLIGVQLSGSMLLIAAVTAGFIRAVIENRAPARRAAASASEVKNAESAQPHQPSAVSAAGADGLSPDQCVGDQPGRAAGGVHRTLAQSGRGDHRRGAGRTDRRDQGVEALDAAVAEADALLGIAAHLPHRVIDIDVGDRAGVGQQRARDGQLGQQGVSSGCPSV